jgi:hypothetical protein
MKLKKLSCFKDMLSLVNKDKHFNVSELILKGRGSMKQKSKHLKKSNQTKI